MLSTLARAGTLLLVSVCWPWGGSADPFERFELPGGIRLIVWQVEDAPRQSTFTFLPLGLALDDDGCAQYAHLVEHMIIRSTDPDELAVEGIQFNGETSAGALRIESYAEPDQWMESLDRHLRWLQLDGIDAQVMLREKGRIQMEEESTVASGYTHKWAEAGWNQIIRHGREHARVHGDVVDATTEQVLSYAKAALARPDQVLIASVGPIDATKIRDFLQQELEATVGATDSPSAGETDGPSALKDVSRQATWDLQAHHYLEWIPLPDQDASQRVAGQILSQLVSMGLFADKSRPSGHALASVVVVPEGRYLMLSASLAGEDQIDAVRASFKSALAGVGKGSIPLPMALMQLKYQASQKPNPSSMRKQLENLKRDTSLIEAQMLLTAVMNEWQLGLTFDEIQAAWEPIDVKWMEAYLEGLTESESPSSLFLQPQ